MDGFSIIQQEGSPERRTGELVGPDRSLRGFLDGGTPEARDWYMVYHYYHIIPPLIYGGLSLIIIITTPVGWWWYSFYTVMKLWGSKIIGTWWLMISSGIRQPIFWSILGILRESIPDTQFSSNKCVKKPHRLLQTAHVESQHPLGRLFIGAGPLVRWLVDP